ncbi:MAG TPA: hypothetical protein VMR23_08035 [Candidatus Limnocylindria bacterium]|nr:hypothetical protein [Candidatus Limnocylindria bacterium]
MPREDPDAEDDGLHAFAGGEIQSRHGIVNRWLIVVYVLLSLWAVYYLIAYWNGP